MNLATLIQKLEEIRQQHGGSLEVYEDYDCSLFTIDGDSISTCTHGRFNVLSVVISQHVPPDHHYDGTIYT